MEFLGYALGPIILASLIVGILGLLIGIWLASKWTDNVVVKILMAITGFVIGAILAAVIVFLVFGLL